MTDEKYPTGVYGKWKRCGVVENKEMVCPHCSGMEEARDREGQRQLLDRLNHIEGQVCGMRKMLTGDAYYIDVLNQASATSCVLNSFTKVSPAAHLKPCVAEDMREDNTRKLDELVRTLQKLMR